MRLKYLAAAFFACLALLAPIAKAQTPPPGFVLGSNGFYYATSGGGPYSFNGSTMTLISGVGNQLFQCSSNGTATSCPTNVGVLVGQASGNNWIYTNTGQNGITIYIDACGGGGGGGGGQTGGSTAGGGGGSGAACVQGYPVHVAPSGTLTLFVGVAGAGGAAGVNGLAGQNTTSISGAFPSITLQGGFGGIAGAAGTGGNGNVGGGIGGAAVATSVTAARGPYYAAGSGSGVGGATAGAATGGGSNVTVLGGAAGAGNGAGGGGGDSDVCQGGTGGVSGSPGISPVSCFGGGGGGGGSGAAGANASSGTIQGYGAW